MNQGLFDRVCGELCNLSELELREVLSLIVGRRQRAKRRQSNATAPVSVARKGKSFRTLRAFGIWSNRAEIKDPVHFTTQLRRRMERGEENK
jgi:hypothetical protein